MTKPLDVMALLALRRSLQRERVPENLHDGLMRYVTLHIPTGSFLRAVLENDLLDACRRADPVTGMHLPAIVRWLDAHAPADCYGSPAAVAAWLARRPG